MKQKICKTNKVDPIVSKGQKLIKPVVEAFINEAILNHQIDLKGKNEIETHKEIMKFIKVIIDNEIQLEFYTDYRSVILKEARKFNSLNKKEFACVFYAIWFEHWINNLIAIYGVRNKLSQDEIFQVIRESNVRSKLSWILKLLSIPTIAKKHKALVLQLFDLRNSFIHFKWKGYFSTEDEEPTKVLNDVLQRIEKTVKYFKIFESKYLYNNSRTKVKKYIKSKPNQQINPPAVFKRGSCCSLVLCFMQVAL